jgi:hypothetical protein
MRRRLVVLFVACVAGAMAIQLLAMDPPRPGSPQRAGTPGVRVAASPFITSRGRLPLGVTPLLGPEVKRSAPETAALLHYYGGPVVTNVVTVDVLWGTQVDPTVAAAMPGFLRSVTSSSYMDWLCEYNTLGLPPPTTNQVIGRGTFQGQFTITPRQAGTLIHDQDIQDEIAYQLAQGNLPQPQFDAQGYPQTLYLIEFPPGITIVLPDGSQSCQVFCAYHGTMLYHQNPLMYSVHPDYGAGSPCAGGCGLQPTPLQNQESVHSHEMVEAVTDPEVGLSGQSLGWYDDNNGEIGDICNGQEAALSLNGTSFTVQKEWSNRQSTCVTGNPGLAAPPSISGTASVPSGGTISLSASGGASPFEWSFDPGTGSGVIPGQTAATLTIENAPPSDSGTFTVSSRGTCTGQSAPWSVKVCPAIALSPAELPGGAPGQAYNQVLTATGGAAPYSFAITAGTLPPGLALSAAGVLSGTLSSAGAYPFTVTATDASGCSGNRAYSLQVANPPAVSRMAKMGNPFRIVVFGSNLQDPVAVTINGVPWGSVAWKSTSKIVLKGGQSLKQAVPKGIPTDFTFANPDGVTTGVVSWSW